MKLYAEDPENTVPGQLFSYVYLHRKLETISGFDLVNIDEPYPEPGIYDVDVVIKGKEYKAKLFYWYCDTFKINKGLVVALDDEKGMLDASIKFMSNASFI